jgi:hypothetical protein
MIILFRYCWFFSSFLTFTKNLTKIPHFQYLSPYQHININIPHSTYSHINISHTTFHKPHSTYSHTTFHLPRTTYHIPTYQYTTYHILHITYPHAHILTYQHITYHIPTYHHIPHSILSLLFRGFFYCPNFCVFQYSIILPKNYTIIKIQKYFVKLNSTN